MRHRKLLSKYMALTICASMTLGCMVTSDNVYANETNITSETEEWNLKAIEADYISEETVQEENKVKVAVLDSGIDFSENVNVVERKDFTGEDISPLYEDATGHGTAVAAVIGASGEGDTIKGINPDVEIYSAKILDENNRASIDKVVNAIDWAIEKKVNIINMSFSKKSDSATLHNAIKRAYNAGILMVASTGNEGSSDEDNVEYPAAYKEVVAVGAVTPEGKLSDMTSTGKELELLAPGEYIKTTGWLDIENISSGTSFATPHVTGVASLLWQKDITKSADFIRKLLVASAKTITEEDGKEYSLVDYEYACKIYDEYNEQYTENDDVEELTEEFENESEAEDYSDEVEGRWSRSNHEVTVTKANDNAGGLTSSELAIVKVGVRAPDTWYSAGIYDGTNKNPWYLDLRMFHAMDRYNYVRVYEYIMNMALECKNRGIAAAQAIAYPDNNVGIDNECAIVKNQLNKDCITNILIGTKSDAIYNYKYTDKRAALVMLGFAMHVVGDTFAHKAGIFDSATGTWRPLGNLGYKPDSVYDYKERWKCAKASCAEVLATWNGNCYPNYMEYNFTYAQGKFKLEKFKTFCMEAPNGSPYDSSDVKAFSKVSYAD